MLVYERPDHRSGASAATSPRTAATWSSPSATAPSRKNRVFYKDLRRKALGAESVADRRLRRRVPLRRQRRRQCSTSRPTTGAPRGRVIAIDIDASRPKALEDDRPEAQRDARRRRARRRPLFASYLKDAHDAVQGLRRSTASCVREVAAARHRHRRRLRRQAATTRDVLHLHQLHHAADASTATTSRPARATCSAEPKVDFDPARLRDEAGLLHEQGRHAGADVHLPQEGPRSSTATTRRCCTATAASTSR